MNTKLPIGLDDFKEMHDGYYFTDKTAFIRQLIDQHAKVTLITRPRRFGKTMNMMHLSRLPMSMDFMTGQSVFLKYGIIMP
jgi:hypothetical protein